jgi:hypothetical protein
MVAYKAVGSAETAEPAEQVEADEAADETEA